MDRNGSAISERLTQLVGEMTKWIKWPGPGQIRGEGKWYKIEELVMTDLDWEWYHIHEYVPTYEGDEPPAAEVARE